VLFVFHLREATCTSSSTALACFFNGVMSCTLKSSVSFAFSSAVGVWEYSIRDPTSRAIAYALPAEVRSRQYATKSPCLHTNAEIPELCLHAFHG
jgi:hypothetical protein